MKKTKILLGSMSLVALTSVTPMLASCNNNNNTETYVVSLYAGAGQFGAKSSLTLRNVKKGTKIKDIAGFVEPKALDTAEVFAYFLDQNGNKLTAESTIDSDIMAQAYYKEVAKEKSTSFTADNWATLIKFSSSAVLFYKTYMDSTSSITNEAQAVDAINEKIKAASTAWLAAADDTPYAYEKEIKFYMESNPYTTKARLVDAKIVDGETKLIYQFSDVVAYGCFDPRGTGYAESWIREYCNDYLVTALPVSVQEALKEYKTITAQETTETIDKLFIPACREINKGVETTAIDRPFSFYDVTVPSGKESKMWNRLLYGITSGYVPYWTRSGVYQKNQSYWINNNTNAQAEYRHFGGGIIPCFCL